MVQHYCGYLNNTEDWWPGEEKEAPEDKAQELIERGYAVAVETKVIKAAAEMTEAIKVNRTKR